jgi:Flp pilus assembly protein TadD
VHDARRFAAGECLLERDYGKVAEESPIFERVRAVYRIFWAFDDRAGGQILLIQIVANLRSVTFFKHSLTDSKHSCGEVRWPSHLGGARDAALDGRQRSMKRPTIIPSVIVLAFALSSCAGTQIDPPAASVVAEPGPSDIGGAVELAQSQRSAGDFNGATATLSQLVLIAPDDPRVLAEYGKTLVDRGESTDALAFLQRAIELNPGEWSFYSAQGVAFAQSGDFRAAQVAFGRALTLKPNDPVVLNNFALAHLQAGNLDQAEALLLRASLGGPPLPKIAQNLALVRQLRAAEQPSAPSAAAAISPLPPGGTTESETPANINTAPAPLAQESIGVADIGPIQEQEPVPDIAADSITAPAPIAPVLDLVDADEDSTEVIAAKAEPTVQNEVIETADLREVGAEDSTEVIAAKAEPTVQNEVIETAELAEVESAPAAHSDIWIPSNGPIYLQVGAFASEENAGRFFDKLETLAPQIALTVAGERTLHRVVVGPYADRDETVSALAVLREFGIDDVQVLTRLPGEVQRRDGIANGAASDAPAGESASAPADPPDAGPSLRFSESL